MPSLTVSPAQYELLQGALTDAVYYRDPPQDCEACAELNDETKLCPQCTGTLARSTAYRDLSRQLGE
jgi:hypothetical protein